MHDFFNALLYSSIFLNIVKKKLNKNKHRTCRYIKNLQNRT